MENEPSSTPLADLAEPKQFVMRFTTRQQSPGWAALVIFLAWLYRAGLAFGALALVWRGGSAWLLVAILPLFWFGPKCNANLNT